MAFVCNGIVCTWCVVCGRSLFACASIGVGDWKAAKAVDGRVLVFLKILPIREDKGAFVEVSLLECVPVAPADRGLRTGCWCGAPAFTV